MENRLQKLKFSICREKSVRYVLIGSVLLSLLVFVTDNSVSLLQRENGFSYVERNLVGEGSRMETLIAELEDGSESIVEVQVGELEYTQEEVRKVLEEVCGRLPDFILGENSSLDRVSSDLYLISRIPETNIEVNWELSDYSVMDITGKIRTADLKDEGTLLELTAILTCQNETVYHTIPICLYPAEMTAEEKWKSSLQQSILTEEQKSRTQNKVLLPEEYQGKSIRWKRQKEQRWVSVLFLGAASAGLFYLKEREDEKKALENRRQQMMLDYSGIIHKLTIYTGAGMALRNAWGKIVQDYERNQRDEFPHYAYEEMVITWHELGDGAGEKECYERFGSRCQLQSYMKLGALLGQNMKKGTKGLSEQLRREAENAFEERKQLARKQGEEAGTRLLIPMFGMLAVVLVIVIVPAFLSLQL